MAKKRYTEPLLQGVPTTISPVAKVVDTFVRPEATQDVNQDLRAFVENITPVLREATEQKKREQLENTRAIVTGLKEQETFQARSIGRKMLLEAGKAFVENQDKYVADESSLVKDRQEFFTRNLDGLQKSGMSFEVLQTLKSDLEAGDFSFYNKTYQPLVLEKKVKDALNILSSSILDINEAVMLPPEKRLELLTKEVEDFQKAYPYVPRTDVNNAVEQVALTVAGTKDKDNLNIGTSIYSDWMVQEERDKTTRGSKVFADITNKQAARDAEIERRIKEQDKLEKAVAKSARVELDNAIKPFINNLSTVVQQQIKDGDYIDDQGDYEAFINQKLEEQVAQFPEEQQTLVRQAFVEAWELEASKNVNDKLLTARSERNKSNLLSALINFQPTAIPLVGVTGETQSFTTFGDYFEEVTTQANLTTDVAKEQIATKLLEQILIDTPIQGANMEVLTYLNSKGYLSQEENQQTIAKIIKADEKFKRVQQREAVLDAGISEFVATGNINAIPEGYVNEQGNTVSYPANTLDAAYEKANGSKDLATRIREWYIPNGRVPQAELNVVNSFSSYWRFGDLGTVLEPSENVGKAAVSYEMALQLVENGIDIKDIFPDEDQRVRFKLLQFEQTANSKSFTQAVINVQGAKLDEKEITTVKDAQDLIDTFSPLSKDFSETIDALGNAQEIMQWASYLKKLNPSLSEEEYLKQGFDIWSKDHAIIRDSEGNPVTISSYNTDVSGVGGTADLLTGLSEEIKLLPTIQSYVINQFGSNQEFGIRIRDNANNTGMLDILVTDGKTGQLTTLGSFTRSSVLKNPDLIKETVITRITTEGGVTETTTDELEVDYTEEELFRLFNPQTTSRMDEAARSQLPDQEQSTGEYINPLNPQDTATRVPDAIVDTISEGIQNLINPDLDPKTGFYLPKEGEPNVDWDFISKQEGSLVTEGYVPEDSDGVPLGNSGVTISTGVDLGSKDASYFEGLPQNIIDKMSPYFGLKGSEANQVAYNLKLTKKEAKQVYEFTKEKELNKLRQAWQEETGTSFDRLPVPLATVIASVAFQYGDLERKTPNFWRQVTTGDLDGMLSNLADFGDKYPSRRGRELTYYIANTIG